MSAIRASFSQTGHLNAPSLNHSGSVSPILHAAAVLLAGALPLNDVDLARSYITGNVPTLYLPIHSQSMGNFQIFGMSLSWELNPHRRFTKPLLCQLSYRGIVFSCCTSVGCCHLVVLVFTSSACQAPHLDYNTKRSFGSIATRRACLRHGR